MDKFGQKMVHSKVFLPNRQLMHMIKTAQNEIAIKTISIMVIPVGSMIDIIVNTAHKCLSLRNAQFMLFGKMVNIAAHPFYVSHRL